MDVTAVLEATKQAVERARAGEGPTLLEALTYRYRGHSMADPAQYRTRQEESEWQQKDPIESFRRRLLSDGFRGDELEKVDREIEAVIEEAVRFAEESPELPLSALYEDIYAE
jgi:pyruvate dehydrogenase E1 component alpha subunit